MYYTSNLVKPKTYNTIYINSPPQTQGGCETSLSLPTKSRRPPLECGLVKISTSWSLEEAEISLKGIMDKMIMNKMTIDLNMFSPFMEDFIVSNMNDTLIVTIKRSSRRCEHTLVICVQYKQECNTSNRIYMSVKNIE